MLWAIIRQWSKIIFYSLFFFESLQQCLTLVPQYPVRFREENTEFPSPLVAFFMEIRKSYFVQLNNGGMNLDSVHSGNGDFENRCRHYDQRHKNTPCSTRAASEGNVAGSNTIKGIKGKQSSTCHWKIACTFLIFNRIDVTRLKRVFCFSSQK